MITLPGLRNYIDKGFSPTATAYSSAASASTNMEYASTDFAVSRFAAALEGKSELRARRCPGVPEAIGQLGEPV